MRKGSAVILTIVAVVAAVGLVLFLGTNMQSPTGDFIGGGGNVPLKLSGEILNCGRCDGKLLFIRQDGTSDEGDTTKGRARNCAYKAKVKARRGQDNVYDVAFKKGPFIQTLVINVPSFIGGGGNVPLQIDLDCATPVPTPSESPTEEPTEVPTEEPTEVPTEEPTEVPTDVPTEAPTEVPTEVPTTVPTTVPTGTPVATTPPCKPFASVCDPIVDTCCDAGVPCSNVGAGTFRCGT